MFSRIMCVVLLAASLPALGCSDGTQPDPVASVAVTPAELTIAPGSTVPYSATVTSADGRVLTDRSVTWSSSEPSVASVNANTGVVTTLASGTATISAASEGQSGSAQLHVAFPVESVVLSPDSATLSVGGTQRFTATIRDASGNVLVGRALVWMSTNATVVRVDSAGLVSAIFPGVASVIATSEGRADTALVRVTGPVATITVTPDSAGLLVGGSLQLTATLRDAQGNVLTGHSVTWATSNSGVAQVEETTGRVVGVSAGTVTITAMSEGRTGSARISVAVALRDETITAGLSHTCALSTAGTAYCWGGFTDSIPAPVPGGHVFRTIGAGSDFTCALTPEGAAYCWGGNDNGQLGNGTVTSSAIPTPVEGGHVFRALSVGVFHTCAIELSGAAFCWGDNFSGGLGDGTNADRSVPVAVHGGYAFRSIGAGRWFTCGVTVAGHLQCWGRVGYEPEEVPSAATFASVSAGVQHACALSVEGAAYCWGYNDNGQLGDGSTVLFRADPAPVAGLLVFRSIDAGHYHSCALTASGAAYCWGSNTGGQLGDGTTSQRRTPTEVLGGFSFRVISGGSSHTAAVSTSGVAYAWGSNEARELGDGTSEGRTVPTPVATSVIFR